MANTLKFGNGQWATGNGTALAYNDENANFKPLPFDFTRASSGTTVNQSGLIETVGSGIPRIDFLGNTKGALLLEPSRTNSLPYSADFSTWSATGGASVVGNKLGVGGSNDAFEFSSNGSANTRLYYSLSNTGELSFSVFAKKNTLDYIALYGNGGSNPRVWFNLANGTLGNQEGAGTGSIESYGNGWYRCTMNWNSASLVNVRIYNSNANDVFGGTAGSVFIQYSQLEEGSYATSYIPTSGSAVTRVRDLSDTQNLSHVIGQTEGVIFYDAILVHKSTSTSEDLFELSIDDGSANNAFFINNYNNTLTVLLKSGGSTSFSNNSFNPTEGARYKLGFAYKQNDFALYINGNQIATDSSGTVPSMNQITFGNYYDNRVNFQSNVKVNDFKLYNTRLTNSELAALTQV